MVVVPHYVGKRGLPMKNGEERCSSPTLVTTDSEVATRGGNCMSAARGGNHMLKIPDAVDEIEVLCMAMDNLKDL
jgi:hypothetical protein